MSKRFIVTEEEKTSILSQYKINEQYDREVIMSVQKFLNDRYRNDKTFKQLDVDGKTGSFSQTEKTIEKYQLEKGLQADGQLGPNTIEAMRKDGLGKFEDKFLGLF